MPYCPACEFEYVARTTHCPECGAALVAALPSAPARRTLDREAEAVRLCRVADATEADLLCAALREAGIPHVVQSHGPMSARFAVVTDGQAPDDYTTILVSANRLADAHAVLEAFRSGPIQWPVGMEPEE